MTHAKKGTHAPDVLIANAGTVFVFCPLTSRAKEWIDENAEDAAWYGDALIVDHPLRLGSGAGHEGRRAGIEANEATVVTCFGTFRRRSFVLT